jgi:transposase
MHTDVSSLPDDPAQLKALLARAYQDLNAAEDQTRNIHQELQRTQGELDIIQGELHSTHGQLDRIQGELERVRNGFESERRQHEEVVSQFEETVTAQQRRIEKLEHEMTLLLRRLHGPKQERIDPDQLLLFDIEELRELVAEQESGDDDEPPVTASSRKRNGHGRRRLPEHLPREQVIHDVPDEERTCPCCGGLRHEIGRETSEQLEFVPASFKVIEHIRIKYACRECEEQVTIAPKPPQPIEKGLPGPGLLAYVTLSKYGDHLPLYRQEDILARFGILIRRSTLCDWIAAAADLVRPLYDLMCRRVLLSKVIHTDDTPVKLLDPLIGHARQARFWAYIGDPHHPYSVYDFTENRKRDGPEQFLTGFEGYLQADAYGGYDGIYLNSGGAIIEVACWAHARRKWWEAKTTDPRRAHEALGYIGRLYQLEEAVRDATPEERRAMRQEHALPILETFRAWIDEQQPQVLPKSPLGQALGYTLNQWTALNRYCEDGDLSIDNNVSERTVKVAAIGRKNWLFVATPAGGRRAAILLSLTASAKANQVEPWAWLQDLFTRLPQLPDHPTDDDLEPLLPDHWLADHPHHRWTIDNIRRQARPR